MFASVGFGYGFDFGRGIMAGSGASRGRLPAEVALATEPRGFGGPFRGGVFGALEEPLGRFADGIFGGALGLLEEPLGRFADGILLAGGAAGIPIPLLAGRSPRALLPSPSGLP